MDLGVPSEQPCLIKLETKEDIHLLLAAVSAASVRIWHFCVMIGNARSGRWTRHGEVRILCTRSCLSCYRWSHRHSKLSLPISCMKCCPFRRSLLRSVRWLAETKAVLQNGQSSTLFSLQERVRVTHLIDFCVRLIAAVDKSLVPDLPILLTSVICPVRC